jgi:hypothetical protein
MILFGENRENYLKISNNLLISFVLCKNEMYSTIIKTVKKATAPVWQQQQLQQYQIKIRNEKR